MKQLILATTLLGLAACTESTESPLELRAPPGAMNLEESEFPNATAHQLSYILHAQYPASPALEFYKAEMPVTWKRCKWSKLPWESFVDTTVAPERTAHQQLTMWVNDKESRTLALIVRYYSPTTFTSHPETDEQHVAVVEYFRQNVQNQIYDLKLDCEESRNVL